MNNMNNQKISDAAVLPLPAVSPAAGQAFGGLHAAAVDKIGGWIVQGRILPGEILTTAQVNALGLSRSVLREAIKVLAGKGLIESRPRTGTRVRPRADWNFLDPDVLAWRFSGTIGPDDVRALFELRSAIEPMAASLAAMRASDAQIQVLNDALARMDAVVHDGELFAEPDLLFHQTILRMTGNELIGSLAALIETALVMSFRLSIDAPEGQEPSMPLHRKVAERIAAHDPDGARDAMIVLLKDAENDVRHVVEGRNRRRGGREKLGL